MRLLGHLNGFRRQGHCLPFRRRRRRRRRRRCRRPVLRAVSLRRPALKVRRQGFRLKLLLRRRFLLP